MAAGFPLSGDTSEGENHMTTEVRPEEQDHHELQELSRVTIRFAGDSGDGMQLAGTQFTKATALFGNDISTLPDFPAEIRAPRGSLPGVSGFQISFSSDDIMTPGDEPDALIAMNPAALKTNIGDLRDNGILIVDKDEFDKTNLKKAGYATNPLEDGSLKKYQVYQINITKQNEAALEGVSLSAPEKFRCRNFYALGVVLWLYGRSMDSTLQWINDRFKRNPTIIEANTRALKAGYYFGETAELFHTHFRVPKAALPPGEYRHISGNEATAMGFLAASVLSGRTLFYGSYPITPASDILHELSTYKNFGVLTFQAEDEIAAVGAAIGASFGGALGLCGTSGPGVALKSEAIGLAVMVELPLVVANIQRAGPSTGMPTKTEQADLLQAMYGRNGECPVAIVAPSTPSDCFWMAIEAFRLATKYMTPVLFLSDGYLGNGSEPWRIPSLDELPALEVEFAKPNPGQTFEPYVRDETTLARPWAVPGTPGLEHRIGGLEKSDITGDVDYEPENHERMVHLRHEKIQRIVNDIPDVEVEGPAAGDLLVLGWGSTYGAITSAAREARGRGKSVASAHLRHLNPFPKNLGAVLKNYKRVLIPEMNLGQLSVLVRSKYLVDAISLSKVQGQPFKISEISERINEILVEIGRES
jgi:2-oxoglutarate ferredoxin oxidoreductase subunit alpha